jgi:hypothetical protein
MKSKADAYLTSSPQISPFSFQTAANQMQLTVLWIMENILHAFVEWSTSVLNCVGHKAILVVWCSLLERLLVQLTSIGNIIYRGFTQYKILHVCMCVGIFFCSFLQPPYEAGPILEMRKMKQSLSQLPKASEWQSENE